MGRLFVTERELDFFSDIVKEVMKDISGQSVYYYPVNAEKTNADDVYGEAIEKIFDRPLYVPAVVEYEGTTKPSMDGVGLNKVSTLKVHLHKQDMDSKGIKPNEGDFIQFGELNYEIKLVTKPDIQYGQQEQQYWYSVSCEQSDEQVFYREEQPVLALQQGSVPEHFTQLRGEPEHDVRALQAPDLLGKPLTGAKSSPFDIISRDD